MAAVLVGLADVARECGAQQALTGPNRAPEEFAGDVAQGMAALFASESMLDEYLSHPRHLAFADELGRLGATVTVVDLSA
nr:Dabb family protein [Phytoactinopolyspora alkaliphila]